jgi:hypothetical protein
MDQRDTELFLDWAADEFLAAGRAEAADDRRAHRRQAELFCDIFHALNEGKAPPPPKPRHLIGRLLDKAFKPKDDGQKS